MLKTKFAKTIAEEVNRIKKMPESLDDFKNAYEINKIASCLIDKGCIRKGASSIRYEWEVESRYSENIEFNKACAAKMKRPMVQFTEYNGWEREIWNFDFDFPSEDDFDALIALKERLAVMPEFNQRVGKTHFELKLVPKEYDSINWNSTRTHYMGHNNLMTGVIDVEKIKEIVKFSDDDLFEFCYKGGIRELFVKEEVA